MDDDAYGDMLKMPHIKPIDREKYRKIIDKLIVEEYIEKIIGDMKKEYQKIYEEYENKEREWYEHFENHVVKK